MSATSKKSKTQQLKERWENGELDCGAMTPEFIKGLSPRELGMLGELITIDYFNERGYTLLEQGYRCTEGEADLVLLDELMKIEAELGRDRSKKAKVNGPRTIDLDLLWMDGEIHGGKKLRLPHPLIGERDFVLVPLEDLMHDPARFFRYNGVEVKEPEDRVGHIVGELGRM